MVKMKCPKCNGEMKLPVRKSGASEVRQAKKSN